MDDKAKKVCDDALTTISSLGVDFFDLGDDASDDYRIFRAARLVRMERAARRWKREHGQDGEG